MLGRRCCRDPKTHASPSLAAPGARSNSKSYTDLPPLSSCIGRDNVAHLTFQGNLDVAIRYAFRITVINPLLPHPQEWPLPQNIWRIETFDAMAIPLNVAQVEIGRRRGSAPGNLLEVDQGVDREVGSGGCLKCRSDVGVRRLKLRSTAVSAVGADAWLHPATGCAPADKTDTELFQVASTRRLRMPHLGAAVSCSKCGACLDVFSDRAPVCQWGGDRTLRHYAARNAFRAQACVACRRADKRRLQPHKHRRQLIALLLSGATAEAYAHGSDGVAWARSFAQSWP